MTSSRSSFSATCFINSLLLAALVGVATTKIDFRSAIPGANPSSDDRDDSNTGTKSSTFAPLTELEAAPTSRYHIFVASKPDTGSTLLMNMVLGLFDKRLDANVGFMHFDLNLVKPEGGKIDDTVVTKTHIQDLDVMYTHFQDDYDQVFFIVPNRSEARLEDRYCSHPYYANRILCLEYEDFTYADPSKMEESISYVAKRIKEAFPYFGKVKLLEDNALKRIKGMEETMKTMANMDFNAVSETYQIHGGHQGRKKDGQ